MEKLKEVVSGVLGIDAGTINNELSRYNCEEWDSFNHLLLVSEVESKLGVKLTMEEVEAIVTYEDLENIISKKRD